jgi:hypothetical protein
LTALASGIAGKTKGTVLALVNSDSTRRMMPMIGISNLLQ